MTVLLDRHIQGIRKALVFINSHLDKKLSLVELGQVAAISTYHFHRVFQLFMGETVHQYIIRQRLNRAKTALHETDSSITDVAMMAGYPTHSAFSEAFKKSLGLTPSEFKQRLEARQKQSASVVREEETMKANIVTIDDKQIFYVRKTGNYFESAPKAWAALENALQQANIDSTQLEHIGIGHDNPHTIELDQSQIRFDACVCLSQQSPIPGLDQTVIPGGLYAMFVHTGAPDTIGKSCHYIFGEWLYQSTYGLRDQPKFVVRRDYHSDKPITEQQSDIYVPVHPLDDWNRP